ncbi:M3 family metallopeptidase [Cohnella rhizosphaerae]|uniref:M3 family metallopeptidase n=1 Tax=Cohnella rhizosphaerae TaxID=1457232 RepID=UPI0030B88C82
MTDSYSLNWDLDKIFSGGSESPEFAAFSEALETETAALLAELQAAADGEAASDEALNDWTSGLQDLTARLREAFSYVGCLSAQNMEDRKATAWTEKLQTLSAKLGQSLDLYDAELARVPDDRLEAWIASAPVSEIAFVIRERRDFVKEKLPPALEALAGDLAVDGYHGWGENYQTIVSRIAIPWEEDGAVKTLSAGQAFNKLSHPNQRVRDEMGAKWEEAWAGQADLAADSLNRLAGFRLKLYQARGWQDPLKEPLLINRMSRDTLDAMWEGVAGGMEPLKRYMAAKARLLGKERLDWHDVSAPVGAEGGAIGYGAAAALIRDAFGGFSPAQAKLAERAFSGRWIEAEDRAGKRPGGFCTDFPLTGETRIFMTYSGTPDNVSTLAHELGHAYHDVCVDGLPQFGRNYAMNVAETASTFAEGLVSDALLRAAGERRRAAVAARRAAAAGLGLLQQHPGEIFVRDEILRGAQTRDARRAGAERADGRSAERSVRRCAGLLASALLGGQAALLCDGSAVLQFSVHVRILVQYGHRGRRGSRRYGL